MHLTDGSNEYKIIPMRDGDQFWIAIAKDNIQIGNPFIDANGVVYLIRELREFLKSMIEI